MENGKVKNLIQHSHEKETRVSLVDKFRKVLTRRAIEKPNKPLVEIYLEETLNFTEASILYPFPNAESTMRKARAKHKPKEKKLEASNEVEQLAELNHQLQKHYCQEVIAEQGLTVIFMHQFSIKQLGRIEEIHVDCSITCKDDESSEKLFLVTVLAMVKNQDFPIAFGLLKTESVEDFSTFFAHIHQKSPTTFTPNNILTSCDQNLQEALQNVFPEATVKVMWFFYASSVLNFAKEHGFLDITSRSLFHLSSLKMMLAIPLIPASYMMPGLDALKKWMFEKSVHFEGLCDFIDTYWLASDGAERISIFNGLSHSINNYVQIFNRDLLQNRDLDNLKKSQLLEAITKQASKTVAKLNKTKTAPALKKSQKLQKTVLETATHNWIKANIHLRRPIQFLQQVSHCIDDGLLSFLNNYDLGEKKPTCFQLPGSQETFDLIPIASPLPMISTEPPPLIYFNSKAATSAAMMVEPPPLAPISSPRNSS